MASKVKDKIHGGIHRQTVTRDANASDEAAV